ncbi:hypothetical protein [Streptomyces sp. SID12488]|uniref:hypothetical protein n=1 Tax=Streptomyces sp. SID12488 TaxID=2706040 RepID=UPI0013D99822|nr:hypothetical protein [Streptomyces sp. SID12488]NEA61377.1 hypothetical protein [Streptomyces sp. SID12488]
MSLRAAALRTALEHALDEPVHALAIPNGIRIQVPAPDNTDTGRWRAALAALRTADRWGSNDTTDAPEIWAVVQDEVNS